MLKTETITFSLINEVKVWVDTVFFVCCDNKVNNWDRMVISRVLLMWFNQFSYRPVLIFIWLMMKLKRVRIAALQKVDPMSVQISEMFVFFTFSKCTVCFWFCLCSNIPYTKPVTRIPHGGKYTPVVADLTFNMEINPSVVDLRAITLPSQVNWLRL